MLRNNVLFLKKATAPVHRHWGPEMAASRTDFEVLGLGLKVSSPWPRTLQVLENWPVFGRGLQLFASFYRGTRRIGVLLEKDAPASTNIFGGLGSF